jgi:hypothetical protein
MPIPIIQPYADNGYQQVPDSKMDAIFKQITTELNATELLVANIASSFDSRVPWRLACVVAVGTNVNLSAPGATLDGVTMNSLDGFVCYGQTDGKQNGAYVFNGAATPATRRADVADGAHLWQSRFPIAAGTWAGKVFSNINTTAPVIGTDVIVMQPPANAVSNGTLASRPAASAANAWTLYITTDSKGGFYSDGATWYPLPQVPVINMGSIDFRPAASAATANTIWITTEGRITYSDGVDWTDIAYTSYSLQWAVFNGAAANQPPAITPPSGGATQDTEARAAIASIITALASLSVTA